LVLTTAAGLSTAVGGLLVFAIGAPGPRFMAVSLGFAAGMMVLVSFGELLPVGLEVLGSGWGYAAFLGGMVVMFLIDVSIPHSYEGVVDAGAGASDRRLLRLGTFVALGVAIHNFPEGMATFVSTLVDPRLGTAVAVAIALHNIPEGIAVAAPIYAATGSRKRALLWSFVAGAAEPVGAGLTAIFLLRVLNDAVLAVVLAGVAGMMVFISLDELLPAAKEYGEEHAAIIGAISGMTVMAVSLSLLGG